MSNCGGDMEEKGKPPRVADKLPIRRSERRRQEKEAAKQPPEDYGPVFPRTYDKCPVCGCPARFTVEAMKGDLHIEDILGKEPALFSFEYIYETPAYKVKLVVIGDSCVRCGAFYTLARDKLKGSPLVIPQPPPGGLIIGGG